MTQVLQLVFENYSSIDTNATVLEFNNLTAHNISKYNIDGNNDSHVDGIMRVMPFILIGLYLVLVFILALFGRRMLKKCGSFDDENDGVNCDSFDTSNSGSKNYFEIDSVKLGRETITFRV